MQTGSIKYLAVRESGTLALPGYAEQLAQRVSLKIQQGRLTLFPLNYLPDHHHIFPIHQNLPNFFHASVAHSLTHRTKTIHVNLLATHPAQGIGFPAPPWLQQCLLSLDQREMLGEYNLLTFT